MQDDLPNDDARLLVPQALWVEGWWWCSVSKVKLLGNEKPRPPELQTSSQTSVTAF